MQNGPGKPDFPENFETNGKIFKFLITYANLKQQSLQENFGSELRLVWSSGLDTGLGIQRVRISCQTVYSMRS